MKSSKKAIRLTLTATLVLMLLPLSSLTFAQETCNHIHDGSCSYVEGVACAHIHDESCGEAGELCTHVHDESCGYVEAVPCDHVCDESCFGESATEAEVDEIEAAEPEEPEEPEWGEDPGFELPEQSLVFRLAYGQSPILVGEDFTVVVRELDEDAYIVLPDSFVFDEEVNIDSPDAPNANRLAYTDENDIRRVHLAADEVGAELQVLLQAEEAGSFYLSLLDEVTNSLVSELLVIQVYDELPEAEEEIALMPLAADADYTVTFMTWSTGNNENDPTSFTSVFNSQIVTAGSTCVNPGSPTVMPPKGTGAEAYERIFVGWYAVGDDEQFDFAAPIESDLTVNARFGPQWQTPEQVNDLAELKAALVLAPIGVPTTIELTANITFYNEDNEITIPINRVIKLTSADLPGSPFTIDAAQHCRVITVLETASLTLENIVITGGNPKIVFNNNIEGGGLLVHGKLTLSSRAVISGNYASQFGGGIHVLNGTLIMNGGTIISNQAMRFGGGVMVGGYSGGGGNFFMNGGRIIGNTAGDGTFTSNAFMQNGGGGVALISATCFISGGEISYNNSDNGGGVLIWVSSLDISSCRICSNQANSGGGIYLLGSSSKIAISNADISYNTSIASGGGIYLGDNSVHLAINNTILQENKVIGNNSASGGGAIYLAYHYNLELDYVTFIGNEAMRATPWPLVGAEIEYHRDNIRNTTYTYPFEHAYNNADIYNTGSAFGIRYMQNYGSMQIMYQGPYSEGQIFPSLLKREDVISLGWEDSSHIFMYWSLSPDDSTGEFNPPNFYPSPGLAYDLYAVYRPFGLFEINYNLNGGRNADSNPVQYHTLNDSFPLPIANPTRTDYTFTGWTATYDSSFPNVTTPTVNYSIPAGAEGDLTLTARWAPTAYAIEYNLGGGTNAPSNPGSYTVESSFPIAISPPTRLGYGFGGWTVVYERADIANITEPLSPYSIPANTTGRVTLTADWQLTSYAISYTMSGGTNSPSNPTSYNVTNASSISVTDPTRPGYNFNGWTVTFTDGTATANTTPGSTYSLPSGVTGNITFAAKWSAPLEYPIVYVLGGGTNNASNPASYTVTSLPQPIAAASRNGYNFLGWAVAFDNPDIADLTTPQANYSIPNNTTGRVVLTARWSEANVYAISYTLNGGINATGNPTTYSVETAAGLTFAPPTRVGYTFNGWTATYANPDIADLTVPATSYTIPTGATGNITLAANWSAPLSYQINYDYQGGTVTSPNPANYTVVNAQSLAFEEPVQLGYTFLGWTVAYANGDIDDITTPLSPYLIPNNTTGNIALTANWRLETYAITYSLNSGINVIGNPTAYTVEDAANLQIADPSRSGYSFTGWQVSYSDGTAPSTSTPGTPYTIPAGTTGVIALSATWGSALSYDIDYDLRGGQNDPANPDSYTVEDLPVFIQSPTRLGYQFMGWTVAYESLLRSDIITPRYEYFIPYGTTGKVELAANWQLLAYSITYFLNGGSASDDYPVSYSVEDAASVSIAEPTRLGYEFVGWAVTYADNSTETVAAGSPYTIPGGMTGDIRLSADWTAPIGYMISYDLDGGTNAPSSPAGYTVETLPIALEAPERLGYRFVGWTVAFANADIEDISEPDDHLVIPYNTTGDIALTANWVVVRYSITYTTNGGTLAAGSRNSYTVANAAGISIADPTKAGYDFEGWTVIYSDGTPDGTSPAGSAYTIPPGTTGNIHLIAAWSGAIQHPINYSMDGGSNPPTNPATYSIESTFPIHIANPAKTGYDFLGWTIAYADGASNGLADITTPTLSFSIPAEATGAITLTAHWSDAHIYSIFYVMNDGFNNPLNPDSYSVESSFPITIIDPTRPGWAFGGWTVEFANPDIADITTPVTGLEIAPGTTGDITLTAGGTIVYYTVAFDPGTGAGTHPAYTAAVIGDIIELPTTDSFTHSDPDHYHLIGFHVDETAAALEQARFTGSSFVLDAEMIDELFASGTSVTLYAAWKYLEPTLLAYDANGGTGNLPLLSDHPSVSYPVVVQLDNSWSELSRAGYDFLGWSLSPGEGNTSDLVGDVTFMAAGETITVFAAWSLKAYSVVYDANGGSGAVPTDSASYAFTGDTAPSVDVLFSPKPEFYGYDFLGWSRYADAIVADYTEGGITSFEVNADHDTSITLYATWSLKTYTVTYLSNGGMGTPLVESVSHGQNLGLTPNGFLRLGYNFGGWNTEAGGGGTPYSDSQFVTFEDDLTLYAQWGEPIEYTIVYKLNDGVNATANPDFYTVLSAFPIVIDEPTRPGYDFLGWTASFANTAFADITTPVPAFAITAGTTEQVTLTANWSEPIEYSINYNLNGGTNSPSNPESFTVTSAFPLEIFAPARPGYSFLGWQVYCDDPAVPDITIPVKDLFIEAGAACDITLVANWSAAIDYEITYELDGGVNDSANPLSYNVEQLPLTIAEPTKIGYDFEGWDAVFVDNSGRNARYPGAGFVIPPGTTGDLTLTASWSTPLEYSINYDLDGGENRGINPVSYTVNSLPISIAEPSKAGFYFAGWTVAFDEPTIPDITSPLMMLVIVSDTFGDISLTAHWSDAIAYPITYELDGGSNAPGNPATYTVNSLPLAFAAPTRPGYDFAGWKAAYADGSQPDVTVPTLSFEVPLESTGPITLTAIWSAPLDYSINYSLGGGENAAGNPATYTVLDLPIMVYPPIRPGYEFAGWTVDFDEPSLMDINSPLVVLTLTSDIFGDIALTAHWSTALAYDIEYTLAGGLNHPSNPESYDAELLPLAIADAARTGYSFNGWKVVYSDGSQPNITDPVRSYFVPLGTTGTVNLIASWSVPIDYSVDYVLNGGENPASNPLAYNVEGLPLPVTAPARPGYAFEGWTVDYDEPLFIDITVPIVVFEIAAGTIGDITLTAHWSTALVYSINYELAGGDDPSLMPLGYTVESGFPLAVGNAARPGYDFEGWTVVYHDGSQANVTVPAAGYAVPAGTTGDITLTAHWSAALVYSINYELGGGRGSDLNPDSYSVEGSFPLPIINPVYPGYTFLGWSVAFADPGIPDISLTDPGTPYLILPGITGDITFTAVWSSAVAYTISYQLDGGTNDPANPVAYSVEAGFPILIARATRPGYGFLGWTAVYHGNTQRNIGEPVLDYEIPAGTTGDITLYANWSYPYSYVISYTLGDGYNASGNPDGYSAFDLPLALAYPTCDMSLFVGWTAQFDDVTMADITVPIIDLLLPAGTVGDIRLTAHWEALPGTIGFSIDASRDAYKVGDIVEFYVSFSLPADISGYEAVHIEDLYPAEMLELRSYDVIVGSLPALATRFDDSEPGRLIITLDEAALAGMDGEDVSLSLSFEVLDRARGDITNTANLYVTPRGGIVPADASATAFAELAELPHSIFYAGNGHTAGTAPVDTLNPYDPGSEAILLGPGDLAKDGYAFAGWSTVEGSIIPQLQPGDVLAMVAETTLFAVWKAEATGFSKVSEASGYIPGEVASFEIRLTLPANVSDYGWLRIDDDYPDEALAYRAGSAELTVDGEPIEVAAVWYRSGTASFFVFGEYLDGLGSGQLVLSLDFDVLIDTEGVITNSARLSIAPWGWTEPETPDALAQVSLSELEVYTLTVVRGSGSGPYAVGEVVAITADAPPAFMLFDRWTGADEALVDDALSAVTTFTMPGHDTTLTATYKADPTDTRLLRVLDKDASGAIGTGTIAAPKVVGISVASGVAALGRSDIVVAPGATFGLFADAAFVDVVTGAGSVALATGATTPAYVMVTAADGTTVTYYRVEVARAANLFQFVVVGGSGSGSYAAGAVVSIAASPPPAGRTFDRWIGADAVAVDDALSAVTTFTMPAHDSTLTATYKDLVRYEVTNAPAGFTGSGNLTASINAPSGSFVRLSLKGVAVDPANYSIAAGSPAGGSAAGGSTVITLNQSYLRTLANGTYTFLVEFTDGYAELVVVIAVPTSTGRPGGTVPGTGDDLGLLGLLAAVGALALGGTSLAAWGVMTRRRQTRS